MSSNLGRKPDPVGRSYLVIYLALRDGTVVYGE